MSISIIINAVTGRMGQQLVKTVVSDSDVAISAALARATHPLQGTDIGYLIGANPHNRVISSDLDAAFEQGDVFIDFSLPEHSIDCLQKAVKAKVPVVIGTTGFDEQQQVQIDEASKSIPIVWAANYSLGVNSLILLTRQATQLLGEQSDIEIFEAHHKHKIDAPSGTALAIGEVIADEKNQSLADIAVYDRQGLRKSGNIGFSVMRAGEIIGTHEVAFALNGELVTLRHEAQTRQCFAQGAIEAAKWLKHKSEQGENGLFDMQAVLSDPISNLD